MNVPKSGRFCAKIHSEKDKNVKNYQLLGYKNYKDNDAVQGWTCVSEDKTANEHLERVVSRRRKLFDIAIGSAIPVVLSLSVSLINRISDLEHDRDLVQYRVEQLYVWRDHGGYQRDSTEYRAIASVVGQLANELKLCQYRVNKIEDHSHGFNGFEGAITNGNQGSPDRP